MNYVFNKLSKLRSIHINKPLFLLIVAFLFISIYMYINRHIDFYTNLINGIFLMGLIYLSMGLSTYIHNIGLFKTFRYFSYKLKSGAYSKRYKEVETMSFAEFTLLITSEKYKKSGKYYYIFGFIFLFLSYLMVLAILN